MVPIASAVATDDPEIAANSAHDTTATKPSEPFTPPNQAVDRIDERPRDATAAHECRGHDEQRQRHQGRWS